MVLDFRSGLATMVDVGSKVASIHSFVRFAPGRGFAAFDPTIESVGPDSEPSARRSVPE